MECFYLWDAEREAPRRERDPRRGGVGNQLQGVSPPGANVGHVVTATRAIRARPRVIVLAARGFTANTNQQPTGTPVALIVEAIPYMTNVPELEQHPLPTSIDRATDELRHVTQHDLSSATRSSTEQGANSWESSDGSSLA